MNQRERLVALAIVVIATNWVPVVVPIDAIGSAAPIFAAPAVRGMFKSFRVPTDNSDPRHITLGSDGNMWFTESNINVSQIGQVDASGNITEFVVPTRFSQPD